MIARNDPKTLQEMITIKAKSDSLFDQAFIQQFKTTCKESGKGHEAKFKDAKEVEVILIKGTYTQVSAGKDTKLDKDDRVAESRNKMIKEIFRHDEHNHLSRRGFEFYFSYLFS